MRASFLFSISLIIIATNAQLPDSVDQVSANSSELTIDAFINRTNSRKPTHSKSKSPPFIPLFFIHEQLNRACNSALYASLNVSIWWKDYFNSERTGNHSLLEELIESDMNSDEVYKKNMSSLCLSGFRLYECDNSTSRCRCMKSPVETVETLVDKSGQNPHLANEYYGTTDGDGVGADLKKKLYLCLVKNGQECAPRLQRGDGQGDFKSRMRNCERGTCCSLDNKSGRSFCKTCSNTASNGATLIGYLLGIIMTPLLLIK